MVKLACLFQVKSGDLLRCPRVGSPQASEMRLLGWLCGKKSDTAMPKSSLGKWDGLRDLHMEEKALQP